MALVRAAHANEGDVFWAGGLIENWLWLGRPNWAANIQGAGLVFSRPLAAFYQERGRFLEAHGLGAFSGLDHMPPFPSPNAASFEALCRRPDAPVSAIVPLSGGSDPPSDWRARTVWTAPSPQIVVQGDSSGQLIRIYRYAVALCEDHR